MPGVTLTVALRADLLEVLGMARRTGSPLLALCVDRFQAALARRGARAPGPLQLALWEGDVAINESVNPALWRRVERGGAAAWASSGVPGCSPESSPAEGVFPEAPKTKGANP